MVSLYNNDLMFRCYKAFYILQTPYLEEKIRENFMSPLWCWGRGVVSVLIFSHCLEFYGP